MDRITQSLLAEFVGEHDLRKYKEPEQFEHFAAFCAVRKHYAQALDTSDVVVSGGNDTGIDAVAIIVNGCLVTDVEDFEDRFSGADYLDVQFIFVQAERTEGFDAAKLGNFGFGVQDFFAVEPKLPRNDSVVAAAAVMNAIYDKSGKFKRSKPTCRLYYVTSGIWMGDANLEARRAHVREDLEKLAIFDVVDVVPFGAPELQKAYNQTKRAITRDFIFSNKVDLPEIPGVTQAYLGFLPKKEFLPLLTDESGVIMDALFYDNVRDWQGYNPVNEKIAETLNSEKRSRFVLMNNGVTIIARNLISTNTRFRIDDYQVVNGCQTSHVLFEQADVLDDSVLIPIRLIHTQDENVIESIIEATNRQTEVKQEQFAAITTFAKQLEEYFSTFSPETRLYYERRACQYDRQQIEKTRIISHQNLVRAFASMFLNEPHRTVRSYKSLRERIGQDIFAANHKLAPYFAAAYCLYKLEFLFRNQRLDSRFRQARYQLLLVIRHLVDPSPLPQMNSRAIERLSLNIVDKLSDVAVAEELAHEATNLIERMSEGKLDRDTLHSNPLTEKILRRFGKSVAPA